MSSSRTSRHTRDDAQSVASVSTTKTAKTAKTAQTARSGATSTTLKANSRNAVAVRPGTAGGPSVTAADRIEGWRSQVGTGDDDAMSVRSGTTQRSGVSQQQSVRSGASGLAPVAEGDALSMSGLGEALPDDAQTVASGQTGISRQATTVASGSGHHHKSKGKSSLPPTLPSPRLRLSRPLPSAPFLSFPALPAQLEASRVTDESSGKSPGQKLDAAVSAVKNSPLGKDVRRVAVPCPKCQGPDAVTDKKHCSKCNHYGVVYQVKKA